MKAVLTIIMAIFLSFSTIFMNQHSESETSVTRQSVVSFNCDGVGVTESIDTVSNVKSCISTTPPVTVAKELNNEACTTTVVSSDSNEIIDSETVYIVEDSEITTTDDYCEKEVVETTSANIISCAYGNSVTTIENKEITAIHSTNESVVTTVANNEITAIHSTKYPVVTTAENKEITAIHSTKAPVEITNNENSDISSESTEVSVTSPENSETVSESDPIIISLDGFYPNTTYIIYQKIDGKTEEVECISDDKGIIERAIDSNSAYAEFSYVVDEFYYGVSYYISEGRITNCSSSLRMLA